MLAASRYIDVISGRRKGITAATARTALAAVEPIYAAAINRRNRRYDQAQVEIQHVDVPVISVGNLTLGGTGKTPMVKWLARWLSDRQLQVALISRGYGAKKGVPNDEALELAQALPQVPHLQNPDRVAAARQAVADFATEVILLDDGFQHRRLVRDLDIVLLDAMEPFGYEHLVPRGTLREPISSLRRAHIVCLTRADQVDAMCRQEIRTRVQREAPDAVWCETAHRPRHLVDVAGKTQPIESLRGQRVAAFCGIGNPAAFCRTLIDSGCEIVTWREFPDHYAFTSRDMEELSHWAQTSSIDSVLCTHKDFVKLPMGSLGEKRLHAVVIELDFLYGETDFETAIARIIDDAKRNKIKPAA